MTADDGLISWVDTCLSAAGVRRTGDPELARERAWSRVHRVPTDAGVAWLKTPPADTVFEVRLYELLGRVAPDHVLVPLGIDVARGWVLLPDAGPSFHARRDELDLTAAMAQAMRRYGDLQLLLANRMDELLSCGVVDMRPVVMLQRFDEAVDAVGDVGGISDVRERYIDWCDELADYGRTPSLDHNDLHADNVVGDVARPRFYDWGDSVVSHPFASLLTTLDTLPRESAPKVRNSYLAAFGDPVDLRAEADLACRVALVARALVWLRALAGDTGNTYANAPVEYLQRLQTE